MTGRRRCLDRVRECGTQRPLVDAAVSAVERLQSNDVVETARFDRERTRDVLERTSDLRTEIARIANRSRRIETARATTNVSGPARPASRCPRVVGSCHVMPTNLGCHPRAVKTRGRAGRTRRLLPSTDVDRDGDHVNPRSAILPASSPEEVAMREVFGKLVRESLEEVLDPAVCAVVSIDMQNDAMHPDGMLAEAGNDISGMLEILPRCQAFLEEARRLGLSWSTSRRSLSPTERATRPRGCGPRG